MMWSLPRVLHCDLADRLGKHLSPGVFVFLAASALINNTMKRGYHNATN